MGTRPVYIVVKHGRKILIPNKNNYFRPLSNWNKNNYMLPRNQF